VTLYNEVLPEFHKHKAVLLGVSVDGVWCHAAFARDRRLHFPLLADFEPKGELAGKYRAYRANRDLRTRAVRARSTGSHCVELLLSDRGQSRRRRRAILGYAQRPIANQSRLSLPTIFLIAEQLGLTETALRNALETGRYRKVRSDFMGGIRSGVNGTPTSFNGVRHDGGYDYASPVAGIQMRLAADTSA